MPIQRSLLLTVTFAAASVAATAHADPCKAIPDKGPMPSYLYRGAKFSGPVTYIVDGDGLCVGRGRSNQEWIEVRLSDFYAPELRAPGGADAKATLSRIVSGKTVTCVARGGLQAQWRFARRPDEASWRAGRRQRPEAVSARQTVCRPIQ